MSDENTRFSSPAALRTLLLGVLVALALVTGFAMYQRSTVKALLSQNERTTAALNDTRGQIEALNSRLTALATTPPAAPVADKPAAVQTRAKRLSTRVQREDPRWNKLQAQLEQQGKQLDEHGKQIDAARQDWADSRTELQGSIARTHDELLVLQKKGERNYYEFDLGKSKQFQAKGSVGVRLKKANTKNQYADLELMVDDHKLGQKHVNLYQPVVFYAGDNGRPVELVINNIGKDHIHGYVSEPKYQPSELAAMSASGGNGSAQSSAATGTNAPSQRRKLELPK